MFLNSYIFICILIKRKRKSSRIWIKMMKRIDSEMEREGGERGGGGGGEGDGDGGEKRRRRKEEDEEWNKL